MDGIDEEGQKDRMVWWHDMKTKASKSVLDPGYLTEGFEQSVIHT